MLLSCNLRFPGGSHKPANVQYADQNGDIHALLPNNQRGALRHRVPGNAPFRRPVGQYQGQLQRPLVADGGERRQAAETTSGGRTRYHFAVPLY